MIPCCLRAAALNCSAQDNGATVGKATSLCCIAQMVHNDGESIGSLVSGWICSSKNLRMAALTVW